MGSCNTIIKKCPFCEKGRGVMYIGGIRDHSDLEWDRFDLDNVKSLAEELNEKELHRLHNAVKQQKFYCNGEVSDEYCGRGFLLEAEQDNREAVAQELFGGVNPG